MSPRAAFIYSPELTTHVLREDHPLRPVRLRYTYELLEAYGAFNGHASRLVAPRAARKEEVLTFHTREYVEATEKFSRGEALHEAPRYNFSQWGDNPVFPGIFEASMLSTGASVVAAELVASGQVDRAFNAAGGLHHAFSDHASGFCVFNDPVIAINHLLGRGLKVAYVDIDAHHGDGVQAAFYDTDRVLTISLHESGMFLFPGSGYVHEMGEGKGRGYSVNVPLYPYTTDDTYLWAFREVVPPLLQAFRPDVLVTQLGIDSHCNDPLTHLCLTSYGYVEAIKEFDRLGLPWVALGGGGYDMSAVARCWTLAYGVLAGKEWPDEIPDAYQQRYGLKELRDKGTPPLRESVLQEARAFAERMVEEVKKTIFPIHRL